MWRYLGYEQHHVTWNCKCFTYFFQFRMWKMPERRQRYDFISTVSIRTADMIFRWAIQNSSGSRGGWEWIGVTKTVSNIQCDCMGRKVLLIPWLNCLDMHWVTEIKPSILVLGGAGVNIFLYSREIISRLAVSFGKLDIHEIAVLFLEPGRPPETHLTLSWVCLIWSTTHFFSIFIT
jgi:hypothetical protein